MSLLRSLHAYLHGLSKGRTILWCYAIWYAVSAVSHFDARPRIWLTSIGLSAIIGTALVISTRTGKGPQAPLEPWVVFRLYLMPFCVSSFAALVKDAGYVLIFPPSLLLNLIGIGGIGAFLLLVRIIQAQAKTAPDGRPA
jgi:hypothetical protein